MHKQQCPSTECDDYVHGAWQRSYSVDEYPEPYVALDAFHNLPLVGDVSYLTCDLLTCTSTDTHMFILMCRYMYVEAHWRFEL